METPREAANDETRLQPPPRKGGFASAFQRIVLRREQAPAPFRDSDFESSEWSWSSLEPQPGPAK